MKKLIILSAAPGCGKSTWAKKYIDEHKDENILIISSDEIRKEVCGTYQDFTKQDLVWKIYETRLIEYANKSKNVTVILDALNDLNDMRKKYALIAKKHYDFISLVVLVKPYEDIVKNNKARDKNKWVPEDVLKTLYDKFELPSEEVISLFDEYLFINTIF